MRTPNVPRLELSLPPWVRLGAAGALGVTVPFAAGAAAAAAVAAGSTVVDMTGFRWAGGSVVVDDSSSSVQSVLYRSAQAPADEKEKGGFSPIPNR